MPKKKKGALGQAPPLSASNTRQAWLSQRLSEGISDSQLIADASAIFDVTELTVRKDLKAIYDRWVMIDLDNTGKHKARWMEIGLALFEETREAGRKSLQFGPAVQQFKTLVVMAGIIKLGASGGDSANTLGSVENTQPGDQAARDRIEVLSRNPEILEKIKNAKKLGIALPDSLALVVKTD